MQHREPFSSELIILTGRRGVGKTSLMQRLAQAAAGAHWVVRGLLTPARLEAGQKTGIQAVDVSSGDCRLLASRSAGELHGPQIGPWTFDDQVFDWGNAVLKQALPCDLFVLDELGPLEFDRRQGWMAGFDCLDAPASYRLTVVIVRPEYVETFLRRCPHAQVVAVEEPGEIDQLAGQFLKRFEFTSHSRALGGNL